MANLENLRQKMENNILALYERGYKPPPLDVILLGIQEVLLAIADELADMNGQLKSETGFIADVKAWKKKYWIEENDD